MLLSSPKARLKWWTRNTSSTAWHETSLKLITMDLYSYYIFAHFNRIQVPLMSAFKLFVDPRKGR